MGNVLPWQILRGVWVLLASGGAFAAVYYGAPLVAPFLIAWLIAYILNPLVGLLHKSARLPRWLAVSVSLLIFIAAAVSLITLIVANIVLEIADLSVFLQERINGWVAWTADFLSSPRIQHLIQRLLAFYNENPQYQQTINSNMISTAQTLADFGSSLVRAVLDGTVKLLAGLPNLATVIFVALLAAFFIAKDWNKLREFIAGFTPGAVKRPVRLIWKDLQKALFGYLRAQLILISITAVVVIIGLLILGVPYAITVGLLIGFVDLLPYLGTGAAMVPWTIYVLLQGDYYLGIGLAILYGIILTARQLLEPKVLASSIGLDPLPTLIAMYVGLKLLGVLGLIAGPVALIVFSAIYRAGVFRDVWRYIVEGKT